MRGVGQKREAVEKDARHHFRDEEGRRQSESPSEHAGARPCGMVVAVASLGILGKFVGSDDAYEKLLPAELCSWLKHEHEGEDDHH
ncbi:hypothetical protein [Rhizobium sp. BK008]|uniref:hypothetical protein n=1 Tax=Rhizobium sp. BK008 TaxID=2587094 RepID=UPI00160B4EC5|nr:hypothetical protein [Rhizobium sp. BK008]MBB4249434.1 hypothetical protein [Rhizobium sp. BK008]